MTKEKNKKPYDRQDIILYDFTTPSKFSKEQLKALEIIFEDYSRLLSNYLSNHLRTLVPVKVIDINPITYKEFRDVLDDNVIAAVVDVSPLKGSILIEVETGISNVMLDRLFGGIGEIGNINRSYSEMEKVIIKDIIDELVIRIKKSWQGICDISPTISKIETNTQLVQVIPPSETIILATFKLKIGSVEGVIYLCIPYMTLETIKDKLTTKRLLSGQFRNQYLQREDVVGKRLEKSLVEIKAILGETHITVSDFINLQIGDIIQLDKNSEDEIDILVENTLKFKASVGTYRSKRAIRINQVVESEA